MTTYDTTADVIESSVNFALVDPTTVSGRTHRLHNDSAAALVVSSTGATPFMQGGVNTATLTLPPGAAVNVYSNGTRWVTASNSGRAIFAGKAVTDANGDAVFTFPTGTFTAAPVVAIANETANSTSIVDLRVSALTATSCTVRARVSVPVTLLAVSVYALAGPLVGATIDLIATSAGTTP